MNNLYSKFKIAPPAKPAMAQGLLRAGIKTPPVTKPAPLIFFEKAAKARGDINPMGPGYTLGAQGGALAGFGAFRGLGGVPSGIAPEIEFVFDLDKQDFFGERPTWLQGVQRLKLTYSPASRGTANLAAQKLARLANGPPAAQALRDDLIAEGRRLTTLIYDVGEKTAWESPLLNARGEVDIFGKVIRDEPEKSRIGAMVQLKNWMGNIANMDIEGVMAVGPGNTPAGGATGSQYGAGRGYVAPNPLWSSGGGGQAFAPGAGMPGAGTVSSSQGPGMGTMLAVVGGVAVLGIGAVWFFKKRKK